MTALRIRAPSRLHFGLLAWGPGAPRQFGGVGLMIDRPGIDLIARPSDSWRADGPLAGRTLRFAERIASALGTSDRPQSFQVLRAPAEHVGLGTGTQLGLAVARVLAERAGWPHLPASRLAELAGRGLRSGIGLHGFERGGLIVDGGRRTPDGVPPLLLHLDFPAAWHVLVVLPSSSPGLHGPEEIEAFRALPPVTDATTDRLCRLLLLGLLPAIVERDLPGFGVALVELQEHVGRCFAPVQGSVFASPEAERIAAYLRSEGLHGVGQSSWGPALYAYGDAPDEALVRRVRARFSLDESAAFWTTASPTGSLFEMTP